MKKQDLHQPLRDALARARHEVMVIEALLRDKDQRLQRFENQIREVERARDVLLSDLASAPTRLEQAQGRIAACKQRLKVGVLGPKLDRMRELQAQIDALSREGVD